MKRIIIHLVIFLMVPWLQAQPTLGLLYSSDEVQAGYTLFSNNKDTYLMDNCGLVVNQWRSDYRPGRAVYLLEDGSLLRTAEQEGAFAISGRGGGFERFDWQGNLVWSYSINDEWQQAHHDIAPLPNGNFLCLVWEKIPAVAALEMGSNAGALELWSEAVYELKPLANNQAEVIWEWHLSDHFIQEYDPQQANYGRVADYPRKVNLNYREAGALPSSNFVHLNSIAYHPGLDQIALSSRLYSEVWIIDHSTTSVEASTDTGLEAGHDLSTLTFVYAC